MRRMYLTWLDTDILNIMPSHLFFLYATIYLHRAIMEAYPEKALVKETLQFANETLFALSFPGTTVPHHRGRPNDREHGSSRGWMMPSLHASTRATRRSSRTFLWSLPGRLCRSLLRPAASRRMNIVYVQQRLVGR